MVLVDPAMRSPLNKIKEELEKLAPSLYPNQQSLMDLNLKFKQDVVRGHCGNNTTMLCDTTYLLLPTYKYSMSSKSVVDGVSAEVHDQ